MLPILDQVSRQRERCMKRLGCQAVVAETAFNAVIAWDLNRAQANGRALACLARSLFLSRAVSWGGMADYGFPYWIKQIKGNRFRVINNRALKAPNKSYGHE